MARKAADKTGTYKDAEGNTHYDGRAIVTQDLLKHIASCDRCKANYGQTLSGWEHPAPKDDE